MKKCLYAAFIILLLGSTYLLQSCSSVPDTDYISSYQSANTETAESASSEAINIAVFTSLYENLDSPDLKTYIQAAYAKELYFNDTLNTHRTLDTLTPYLLQTGEHLIDYDFTVVQSFQDGNHVLAKWTMDMTFEMLGKRVRSQSIGISELKFNSDGKIIFHQDFWDSTEGIHKHIPYLGYWVKKARNKL